MSLVTSSIRFLPISYSSFVIKFSSNTIIKFKSMFDKMEKMKNELVDPKYFSQYDEKLKKKKKNFHYQNYFFLLWLEEVK